ncbi:MAG TPA: hypothetical protein PKK69_08570, partial [Ferruginibacter sp.]|nr:hypothetical protein [Ferruginibacter sp.]
MLLTVLPSAISQTTVSVCANQLPYSWNNQTYNAAGNYVVHLTASNGCDSAATLHLLVKTLSSSQTTIQICSNQAPYLWNGNSYNTTGNYSITLTGANGCDSVANLHLIINPVQQHTISEQRCANLMPYNWHGQSLTQAGTYHTTLTTTAGCDSIITLILTVLPTSSSQTTITICSATLPFNWNGLSILAAGNYQVVLHNQFGCDSIARLTLTVNPTPTAPVVSDLSYCQFSASTALTANATGTLSWYNTATGGTGTGIAPVPSTQVAGTFTYYVSQSNNGCESPRAPLHVTVLPKPILGADKEQRICYGATTNLNLYFNPTGNSHQWTFHDTLVSNPTNIGTAGDYTLISTAPNGCTDTAVLHLIIQPEVIANAGPDANAEFNYPYQLHGTGGVSYDWSPSHGLNNSHIADPTATLTQDQTYILLVRDEIGCWDVDTVKLRVLRGPTFYVPTAFTPNGDGLNDIFRPTYVGIEQLE